MKFMTSDDGVLEREQSMIGAAPIDYDVLSVICFFYTYAMPVLGLFVLMAFRCM